MLDWLLEGMLQDFLVDYLDQEVQVLNDSLVIIVDNLLLFMELCHKRVVPKLSFQLSFLL